MDNDKRHIDQLFKEGLDNRSFEIPESFENDLNQRLDLLDKKKGKRGFFLWLLLLFSIIDFSVIALLLVGNNQSPIYSMSNLIVQSTKIFPIPIDSMRNKTHKGVQISDLQNPKKLTQIKSPNSGSEPSLLKATKQNLSILGSEHSISKKKDASQVDNNKEADFSTGQPKRNIAHQESAQDKNVSNSENNNLFTTSTNTESKTNIVNQKKTKPTRQLDLLTPKEEKSDEGKIEITSNSDKKEPLQTHSDSEKVREDKIVSSTTDKTEKEAKDAANVTKFDSEPKLTEVNSKQQSDTITLVHSKKEENKDSSDLISTKETKTNSTKEENNDLHQGNKTIPKWRTQIQLYAGFGSTIINDNAGNGSYLGMVNENRKPLHSPTFGVNGNLSYKNITFGLGLSYLQTGETYSTKMNEINLTDIPYFEYDSIVETISYYQPYGTWIGDSTQLAVDSTTQIHTISDTTIALRELKNRYSWISVPVYFGYRFSFGKYELIPRIGAQFNFGITHNSGQYPDSKFETLSAFNATKFNVSYLVNIELRRNFNKWSLFARPYFKSMIGPAIDESILKRKYSSWGIQVGVGFDL